MTNYVTNGTLSFMERVKTEDYAHKEGKVELSFTVPEDGDVAEVLATVSRMAQDEALRLVGKVVIGRTGTKTAPVAEKAAPAPKTVPSPARPPKIDPPAAEVKPADPLADLGADATNAGPKIGAVPPESADPLADLGAPATAGTAASGSGAESVVSSDPAAVTDEADLFIGAREITDRDLTSAIEGKNAELIKVHKEAGTQKIRELIAKFAGVGKSTRTLAQEVRQKFLDELGALK